MDCKKVRQMQDNLLIDSWSKSNFSFLYPKCYISQATMPLSKSFLHKASMYRWMKNDEITEYDGDWNRTDGTLSELYKFPYQKAGSTQYTCNGWEIFIPLFVYNLTSNEKIAIDSLWHESAFLWLQNHRQNYCDRPACSAFDLRSCNTRKFDERLDHVIQPVDIRCQQNTSFTLHTD